ncbi:hypothetical protein J6590_074822 [Homalodisca vitripennis]|nr:hypothetical protein J6590_074822 [Homalodisca vitripennis]
MPRLRGRGRNIGRRTRHAQLAHDRRLNRTDQEHSTDNVTLMDQVARTRANENSEQRNQHNVRHVNERPMHTESVTNGECKIVEH